MYSMENLNKNTCKKLWEKNPVKRYGIILLTIFIDKVTQDYIWCKQGLTKGDKK